MTRNTALATVLAGTLATTAAWAENVTIEVGYPYSSLFDVTFERIMPLFKEEHPDIDVKFRATYDNYEDGTNTVLRESVADKLPDITFQGLNRQAILVEKGIAQSLEPFIAKEPDFSKEGYHQAMLGLGTFGGQVHGLPFAVSLPVGYYNMDALNKAGITTLPQTWDEVVANCEKLRAAGYRNPLVLGLEHHRELVPPGAAVESGYADRQGREVQLRRPRRTAGARDDEEAVPGLQDAQPVGGRRRQAVRGR